MKLKIGDTAKAFDVSDIHGKKESVREVFGIVFSEYNGKMEMHSM